jgi:hypothetical protein
MIDADIKFELIVAKILMAAILGYVCIMVQRERENKKCRDTYFWRSKDGAALFTAVRYIFFRN